MAIYILTKFFFNVILVTDPVCIYCKNFNSKNRFLVLNILYYIIWLSITIVIYEFYEIDSEYVALILFFLTLEGQVNRWCHALPSASIHSFEWFLKELHQAFDRYDHRDVCKRINQLRMKHDESIEYFSNWFLHLSYEFP